MEGAACAAGGFGAAAAIVPRAGESFKQSKNHLENQDEHRATLQPVGPHRCHLTAGTSVRLCANAHRSFGCRVAAAGKPLEVFTAEDQACRAYSAQSAGANPNDAAAKSVAGSAVVGTVLGAAAGAMIGGGNGVGTGAGLGLIAGTAVGAGRGAEASYSVQRRYDIAYEQCMYAKGNQLPPSARAPYRYGS